MKNLLLLCVFTVGFGLPVLAQTKPNLPQLNDADKVKWLAIASTSVHAGSIAYAKSIGKTPKEYGQAIGKIFIPTWKQALESGKPMESILMHMSAIAQAFNTPFELTEWSAKEAVIKRGMLIQDPRMVSQFTGLGVTAQDMEAWNEGAMGEIATSLGLSLSQRQAGKDVVVTVKKL